MRKTLLALLPAFFVIGSSVAQALEPPVVCDSCSSEIMQGIRWNIILSQIPKLTVKAEAYDIDGYDNTAATVDKIHALNAKAICYVSAGSWEDWRPDAKSFPASVKGKSNGWPGEKWLDIRQVSVLKPIMEARVAMCKSKGFDAVDYDNVDGYTNKTGFPLTAADQLNYNVMLANIAHANGMAVGLKNDLDQVEALVPYFDFSVSEQCFEYNECNLLMPFINANKAVLNIEYSLKTSKFCSKANSMNFSSLKKTLDLTEPVTFCN